MRAALVVGALVVMACGSTTTRMIDTQRYYSYSMAAETTLDREAPPTPPAKAVTAINKFKRVAFVPPDSCLDMRAGDTSTNVEKRVLRMQCGVTMSELEREAERVGFDVVTWQSLKGTQKPLEAAKEEKIDLLFEINELDVVDETDRSESMEFKYFTGEGAGPAQPLQVTPDDNEACKAYHARSAPKISGTTSVLDLKMVQVTTGSVLWSYRHTENMKAGEASPMVKFAVKAKQSFKTSKPLWPWAIAAVGVIVIVASPDNAPIGAGIGGVGVLTALLWPSSTEAVGPPDYEPVPSVLCRRPHIEDVPVAVAPAAPVRSSTFRSDTKTSGKDVLEERKRDLIKRSVNIFMTQLTKGATPGKTEEPAEEPAKEKEAEAEPPPEPAKTKPKKGGGKKKK